MTVINDIFYSLLESKEIVISMGAADYESTRVQLVRKLSRYKDEMNKVGFLADWIRDSSLSGRYSVEGEATYKLVAKKQQKQYTILRTGQSDDTETPEVRTNLECDPGSEVWDLGFFTNPPVDAADSDPSSAQGEDNVLRSAEADWTANSGATRDESGT